MAGLLLVRYGELGLKSPPVRRQFERQLRRNVLDQFVAEGITGRLRSDRGHLYVEVDDPARALRVLRRVFGVTSASVVHEVPTERTVIRDRLLELADPLLTPGISFAVRARRTGTHPFTSQELARDLGADLIDRFGDRGLKVNLDHPELELFVEVRGPRTYLYLGRESGPGGLPLGVAGHVVALVDGPRGALGAYLLMKRGCRAAIVETPSGAEPVERVLRVFDPHLRVERSAADPGSWEPALARLAEESDADGVVLPIDVAGYVPARERWGERVLFSPTVGWTEGEVADRWERITALLA